MRDQIQAGALTQRPTNIAAQKKINWKSTALLKIFNIN